MGSPAGSRAAAGISLLVTQLLSSHGNSTATASHPLVISNYGTLTLVMRRCDNIPTRIRLHVKSRIQSQSTLILLFHQQIIMAMI